MLGYDLNVVERGVRGLFAKEFLTRQRKIRYPLFCSIVDSDKQAEKYNALSTIPQLAEVKDERVLAGFSEYSYELQNKVYATGVKIPRQLLEFDQTGQVRTLVQSMGSRVANFPDKLVFAAIAANGTCYDGQAMFSATHDMGNGVSQSNLLEGNLTNAIIGDSATIISKDNWEKALAGFAFELAYTKAQFMEFTDDRGEPWFEEIDSEGLAIICHPRAEHLIRTVCESKQLFSTGNVQAGQIAHILTTPYTDLFKDDNGIVRYGVWYLLKVDTPVKPFIFQRFGPKSSFPDDIPEADQSMLQALRSVEIQTVMKGGSEIDSHTFFDDEYLVGARVIYSAGYGMWQNAIKVKSEDWT